MFKYLAFILFANLACVSDVTADIPFDKKIIEVSVLGKEIFSLYKVFGFKKIEKDNEYADLVKGEDYWIAIDRNYEFFTIRTMNNIVVEAIVRNPDLVTPSGL